MGTSRYELNFAAASLFGFIWAGTLPISEGQIRKWTLRPIDKRFVHLQSALREVVWKLGRAARLYADAARTFGQAVVRRDTAFEVQQDLSIYLDSVVVYLRIIPDIWSGLLLYLYERSVGDIAHHSFRSHYQWFLDRPSVDPGYTEILRNHLHWFELLAGKKPKGIRDTLVHHFGRFQHPVIIEPPELAGRVGADLVSTSGYVTDAHAVIAQAAHEMCRFFDHAVAHHAVRVGAVTGWLPLDPSRPRAAYIMTYEERPSSTWLFPVSEPPLEDVPQR